MTEHRRYKHSCVNCIYLGSEDVGGQYTDWYVCPGGSYDTYIGRTSDDGEDYFSAPSFMIQQYIDRYPFVSLASWFAAAARHLERRIRPTKT
jgi:hypothetical protein